MTRCRKAFDVDLAALLHDRDDPALAEFRAHYPRCAACDAEVRAWRELDQALRSGDGSSGREDAADNADDERHPTSAELLAYADAPERLAAAEREALTAHLASCATCVDELAALARFEGEARVPREERVPPVAASAASAGPFVDRGRRAAHADRPMSRRRPAGRVMRILLHPAFAYMLVAALLVPALGRRLERLRAPTAEVASRDVGVEPDTAGAPPVAELARSAAKSEARAKASEPAAAPKDAGAVSVAESPEAAPPALADERRGDAVDDDRASGQVVGSGARGDEEMIVDERAPEAASRRDGHAEVARTAPPTGHDGGAARVPGAAANAVERTGHDADGRWSSIDLDPRRSAAVAMQDVRDGLVLRIPAPAHDADVAREIRVIAPGGRQELRERVGDLDARREALAESPPTGEVDLAKRAAARRASEAKTGAAVPEGLSIRVPAGWLTRGEYRVEVEALHGAAGTVEYRLMIR